MNVGCTVFGHKPVFRAEGATMVWECERGCGERGTKTYDTADDALRYAVAFNHPDSADLGKRAPLIGLLPLRLWRAIKDKRDR